MHNHVCGLGEDLKGSKNCPPILPKGVGLMDLYHVYCCYDLGGGAKLHFNRNGCLKLLLKNRLKNSHGFSLLSVANIWKFLGIKTIGFLSSLNSARIWMQAILNTLTMKLTIKWGGYESISVQSYPER